MMMTTCLSVFNCDLVLAVKVKANIMFAPDGRRGKDWRLYKMRLYVSKWQVLRVLVFVGTSCPPSAFLFARVFPLGD